MKTFSFKKGLRVRIGQDAYRFVSKFEANGEETWQVERMSDHLLVNKTITELLDLYADEQLHLDTDDDVEGETPDQRKDRKRRERAVVGELPEHQKAHVAAMKHIIREIDRRVATTGKTKKLPGQNKSPLEIALREICSELGLMKSISTATYYRALKNYSGSHCPGRAYVIWDMSCPPRKDSGSSGVGQSDITEAPGEWVSARMNSR